MGASTRAAAFSAKRAGFRPLCLDMFADLDLRANAMVHQVEDYPHGLLTALEGLPRLPLLYVGGLENQLDLLEEAAKYHDILGNSAEVVKNCRDQQQLVDPMRMAQVELPEWLPAEAPPEPDGTWLLKPVFGSGGRGIAVWDKEAATSPTLNEPHGYQKRIDGIPYSASYIAADAPGDIRFVGVTQQLIGLESAGAVGFQWAGNIGPTTLSIPVEHKMRRAGNILKWKLGLKGVFGIDFILTADERVFVTEVNPRYPASLELLEFATGQNLVAEHVRCFAELDTNGPVQPAAPAPILGKVILYATQDGTLQTDLTSRIQDYSEFPQVADLPAVGTDVMKGSPVCTLFAQADSVQSCRSELEKQGQLMRAQLTFS